MKSVGIIFPGQGSQSVGMMSSIAQAFPEVRETFAEASAALNYDLWKLTAEGPVEELNKTVHTQPALLTASYAIWCILKKKNLIHPKLLAGHSLGEYSALVCAQAMAFPDAVRLVAARGEYMQEAVPVGKGALAVIIGLDHQAVKALCEQAALGDTLSPANFNSPEQIVIGGDIAAVERGILLAKEMGAKLAKSLPVSVPSHCLLMKPAAEKLEKLLATLPLQKPVIPVVNNVDVKVYDSEQSIRDGLVRQLFMPVRWVEVIHYFVQQGITQLIECGPGKVLCGLNKRIAPEMQLANTADLTSLQEIE